MQNIVILAGNIGQDPESRTTQGGTRITQFSLATSRPRYAEGKPVKDDQGRRIQDTEWHRITFYRKLAEIAGQYLKKGSQVYIEGRLQTRKWTDQNGQERYTTEIVIPRFRGEIVLLESKGGSGNGGGAMDGDMDAMEQYHSTNTSPASKPSLPSKGQGAKSKFDDLNDDIPF